MRARAPAAVALGRLAGQKGGKARSAKLTPEQGPETAPEGGYVQVGSPKQLAAENSELRRRMQCRFLPPALHDGHDEAAQ
jgi:hypothetical protein